MAVSAYYEALVFEDGKIVEADDVVKIGIAEKT